MDERRTNSHGAYSDKLLQEDSRRTDALDEDWDMRETVKDRSPSRYRAYKSTNVQVQKGVSAYCSIDVSSLLSRITSLENYITSLESSSDLQLMQATIKALKADNAALKEENRVVTEVMREWEQKERTDWKEMKTRLEDSIRMLEDQLAAQTEEKMRIEKHYIELEARFRLLSKHSESTRVTELEAEVRRLQGVVEDKDQENNRMVRRLHAFMQEAETAKSQLRSQIRRHESKGRLTPNEGVSRKNSFVEQSSKLEKENVRDNGGKSGRTSPILGGQKRQGSVGRGRV